MEFGLYYGHFALEVLDEVLISVFGLHCFIVNFAKRSRSCLVPALSKSTVALVSMPLPWMWRMVPCPKRSCMMMVPSLRLVLLGIAAGDGLGGMLPASMG